jgi:hypothetical protein
MECVEGEMLYLLEPCPLSRRHPYGPCPCGITFVGLGSAGSTTTAEVRELDLSRDEFVACLEDYHQMRAEQGCTCEFDGELIADQVLSIAERLRPGTIIERKIDRTRVRWWPRADCAL